MTRAGSGRSRRPARGTRVAATSAPITTATWQRRSITAFADTSALYALIDRADDNHERAVTWLAEHRGEKFVSHNYVVVETTALIQARLGMGPTRQFLDSLLGVIEVDWVTPELHAKATAALLASRTRAVSLVDRVSFAFMRQQNLRTAFAFDTDFRREGFVLAP